MKNISVVTGRPKITRFGFSPLIRTCIFLKGQDPYVLESDP